MKIKLQVKRISLKEFAFFFVLIDVFFVPYLPFLSMSISAPIVLLWAIINVPKWIKTREGALIVVAIILMAASCVVSLIYTEPVKYDTTFITSVKRTIQYISSLCLYIYLCYNDKTIKYNLERIVIVFFIFITVFAVLYYIFPEQYAFIKIQLSPVDNHTRRYLAHEVRYRFNYLWTDPNNVAYLVASLEAWVLLNNKIGYKIKTMIVFMTIFIIAVTNSNGGIIVFIVSNGLVCIKKYFVDRKIIIDISKVIFIIFFLAILCYVLNLTYVQEKVIEPIVHAFKERFGSYQAASDYSGGRLKDIRTAIKYINPSFLVIGSGKEGFSSEIGHLYLICMYGGIAYLIWMIILFVKRGCQRIHDYIWMFPVFVGFTVNIAIGEYKWLAIYLVILAYSRYSLVVKKRVDG